MNMKLYKVNIQLLIIQIPRRYQNVIKKKNDDIGRELIGILNKNLETKNIENDDDRLFSYLW